MNENLVQCRVKPHHLEKLKEIEEATGLTESQIIRELIENASLEARPMPVSTIANRAGEVLPDPSAIAA